MHIAGKVALFPRVINYLGEDRAASTAPCPAPGLQRLLPHRELLDPGRAVPLQTCLSSVLNNEKGYHLIFFATWRSIRCPSDGMTDRLGKLLRVNPISLGLAVLGGLGWAQPGVRQLAGSSQRGPGTLRVLSARSREVGKEPALQGSGSQPGMILSPRGSSWPHLARDAAQYPTVPGTAPHRE